MIELSAASIAEITGGVLIDGADPGTAVTGPVEFDSRRVTPGSIYMALPGARVDGHDFAAAALDAGAALILIGRPLGVPALLCPPVDQAKDGEGETQRNASYLDNDPSGLGERVITAVSRLARHNTDVLVAENGLTVVGVTGSAGKTSTKDLLGVVFSRAGETIAPPGSLNNEIGHPYTVLTAGRTTKYLIAEMSARGQGHIAHLARIAPPRVGVVLNVGTAHLGEFGSRQGIAQAKGELVEALPSAADGGVAVLNADDELVSAMADRTSARVVHYSAAQGATGDAHYRASDITLDEVARASFLLHHPQGEPVPVRLGVFGAHNVSNALAAAAAAMECGLKAGEVADALTGYTAASANRMDVRTRSDGVTVINDSYNANPDSMRAGIDALAHSTATRPGTVSWAVLGQMAELGEDAVAEHRNIGHYLAERGVDRVLVIGEGVNQETLVTAAEECGLWTRRFPDTASVVETLTAVDSDAAPHPGDVVLIKASYSDGLWRVAEGLHAAVHTTSPSTSGLTPEPTEPAQPTGLTETR